MNNLSPILNILNKSIRASGKKIIRDFGEIEKLQGSLKKTENFIKIAESSLLNEVIYILKKIRPNFEIQSISDPKENCWILDSIDSKINFSRGNENFFIAVSLKENNKILASVFYNPIKDENFYFQTGLGGYKNDYRVRVSETKKIKESIFSFFCHPKQLIENEILGDIRKLLKKNKVETRESGSIIYDLCMLVSGKIDCFIYSTTIIDQKEISGLVLSETGGFIEEIMLKEKKIFIASNKYIGKIVKEMIENIYVFE